MTRTDEIAIRADIVLIRTALIGEAARLRRFARLRAHVGEAWRERRARWRAEADRLEAIARGSAINGGELTQRN